MVLRLYLIRHGETEWSLSGQHTGRSDIPLTARGEDGALELALRLRSIPFAHVFSSPRQRARRTCELAGLGPAARVEPDLAEWDYGDTKDNPPRTSERHGRAGTSSAMVVLVARRRRRYPAGLIG
jgi:broad specificity phosphatase PhoE